MKRIAVLQPFYLPWLGVFNQIASSEVFIFGDDFQYSKNSWINRNRIKNPNGGFIWLTVPVKNEHLLSKKISEVEIDYTQDWFEKHLRSIKSVYGKSPFFKEHYFKFEQILLSRPKYVMDLNIAFFKYFFEILNIRTTTKYRSTYANLPQDKNLSLLILCQEERAEVYLTGPKAMNYLDEKLFNKNNIRVEFQNYSYDSYSQKGKDVVDRLSIIDALFMLGSEKTRELIYQNV